MEMFLIILGLTILFDVSGNDALGITSIINAIKGQNSNKFTTQQITQELDELYSELFELDPNDPYNQAEIETLKKKIQTRENILSKLIDPK